MKTAKELRAAALYQCRTLVPKHELEEGVVDAIDYHAEKTKRSLVSAILELKGVVTTEDSPEKDGHVITGQVYAFSEAELIEYTRAVQADVAATLRGDRRGSKFE